MTVILTDGFVIDRVLAMNEALTAVGLPPKEKSGAVLVTGTIQSADATESPALTFTPKTAWPGR